MLALPGSSYLYQGEELGLPEDVDLPDSARQDPTWFRTKGERYGRDGCRVPIPWEAHAPSFGFGPTTASWLPQPAIWAEYARDVEERDSSATLALYKELLRLRREHDLALGELEWIEGLGTAIVAFRSGGIRVIANTGSVAIELPDGDILVASEQVTGRTLPGDTTVWLG